MVNAPERIWIEPHTLSAYRKPCDQDVEYVRYSDYATLEAENARFRSGLQKLATSFYRSDQYQDYAKHVLGDEQLPARTEASAAVKVKALEWVFDDVVKKWFCLSVVGQYTAYVVYGNAWFETPTYYDFNAQKATSLEAAKDAAQADFERRIRSTLSPAPQEAEAEPFGYWCKHRLSDGVLLKKPAYLPDASADQTVIPLYTHPPAPAVTEAMVETVGEHLFSMGHTGINKRDLRAALQAAQKVKP